VNIEELLGLVRSQRERMLPFVGSDRHRTITTVAIIEEILIEDTAPPGHVDAVHEAFKQAGFDVEVEPAWLRKSADLLPWVVKVSVDGTIGGFFGALGVDAYTKFKALVRDLWRARDGAGNGEGDIDIADSEDTRLILPSSLPEEALDALEAIDWSQQHGSYLVWDANRHEWTDPTRR
jgi:hypothetical protein